MKEVFNRIFQSIAITWKNLNRTIYVGERLKSNMTALAYVSIVSSLLGLILIIVDLITKEWFMLGASILTFLSGVGCAYSVCVRKNREAAIRIPVLFCGIVCTVYVLTGFGEGSAILWSLLIPIGICYFVSVRYGILLSAYYSLLYLIVFYTPLNARISVYYNDEFLQRFPLLYVCLSLFTGMAMIQYHQTALFEIEHANRLSEEVARQTSMIVEQSHKIEQMSFQTIQTLANAIDAKDPYTRGHSTRVSQYAARMAKALGWSRERTDDLRFAGLLHDIGKIGVPDSILNNPRRLTEIEYDIIKSHTTVGREILKDRIMIRIAEDVAGSHHERYDGSGYPCGLKGEEISEESRIVAIADSFDAMNSDRVYRKACSRENIRSELIRGKGTQFDPHFVDVFLNLWDQGQLDEIIRMDLSEKQPDTPENVGSSAVLLQEVVETFVAQNAREELDVTTGIMGRNSGEAAIAQAMKEGPGCLVFFDVDNLKKINDLHGHEAGDRILRLMGDTLKDSNTNALCCRLGGDEFLFYLRDVTRREAASVVKKIFAGFEERKKNDVEVSPASLSAGMVMCTPEDTYAEVFNRADKELYHVKQGGKGNYSFYHEESDHVAGQQLDVSKLVDSIHTSGNYQGAMNVEYREFARLCEYAANLEQRFSCTVKLLVITMEAVSPESHEIEERERAMADMEQSIRQTIRDVDVLTRYGAGQFLVILLGTDDAGVRIAVDRIFRGYYKMNGSRTLKPSYSVTDLSNVPKEKVTA